MSSVRNGVDSATSKNARSETPKLITFCINLIYIHNLHVIFQSASIILADCKLSKVGLRLGGISFIGIPKTNLRPRKHPHLSNEQHRLVARNK